MQVKLTKLSSIHENMRTEVAEGQALRMPVIGMPFTLLGEALHGEGTRVIRTTPVVAVEKTETRIVFETQNSKYALEVLG